MYRENQYQAENQYYKLREKLMDSELKAQEEKVETAKQNRHDLRHHNTIIMEMLEHNDTQRAMEYLSAYEEKLAHFSEKDYCKNYIVNAILKSYAAKAQSANMEMNITAAVPNELYVNSVELCSVISNALENAMEAAAKCENGFIKVKAEMFQDMLKLEIENSCSVQTFFENGMPKTTKKGSDGTGTKSIVQIAEKNGGMAKFSQTENIFTTRILVKNVS